MYNLESLDNIMDIKLYSGEFVPIITQPQPNPIIQIPSPVFLPVSLLSPVSSTGIPSPEIATPSPPVMFNTVVSPGGLYTFYPVVQSTDCFSPTPPSSPTINAMSVPIEIVWHNRFNQLFGRFERLLGQKWYLWPATEAPTGSQWSIIKDHAKVRFKCQDCGHGWTSMRGLVVFWYRREYVGTGYEGYLLFRLFGQQCNDCSSEAFHHAMWYPEEAEKVIWNAYQQVGKSVYNFAICDERNMVFGRRQGKPRNLHQAVLCEACHLGICDQQKSESPSIKTDSQ